MVVFKVSRGYGVNVGFYGDIGGCNVNWVWCWNYDNIYEYVCNI